MPLAFKTHRKLVQVIGKSYMNSNPLTKPPENTENFTGIIFQLLFFCVCVCVGGGGGGGCYIPLQPRLFLLLFCKRVCTNVHAYICINMFMYMYYCKYIPELYWFRSLNFGTCQRFSWRRNE